jgi:hypothetical protein
MLRTDPLHGPFYIQIHYTLSTFDIEIHYTEYLEKQNACLLCGAIAFALAAKQSQKSAP